jgi:hypothetical protein
MGMGMVLEKNEFKHSSKESRILKKLCWFSTLVVLTFLMPIGYPNHNVYYIKHYIKF